MKEQLFNLKKGKKINKKKQEMLGKRKYKILLDINLNMLVIIIKGNEFKG